MDNVKQTQEPEISTIQPEQGSKFLFPDNLLLLLLGSCAFLLIFVVMSLQALARPSPIPSPDLNRTTSPAASNAVGANWKTYINEELKFLFQYPDDYDLDEEGYFYPSVLKESQRYPNSKIGSINITNNISSLLKECNIKHEPNDDPKIITRVNIDTNRISGIKELMETTYLGDNGEGYGLLYINNFCFSNNNKTFTLSVFSYNEIYDADKKIFDQILSTFRFD